MAGLFNKILHMVPRKAHNSEKLAAGFGIYYAKLVHMRTTTFGAIVDFAPLASMSMCTFDPCCNVGPPFFLGLVSL